MSAMQVVPVSLVGRGVRLEPFQPAHTEGLWRVAEPGFFTLFPAPPRAWTIGEFGAWLDEIARRPSWCPFTTILQATGQPVGLTCYLDIRPADRGLEIGSTWIARAHQGTLVNPEAKYLLLRHAFETLGAIRVQLKTDRRNVHSQRAIAKLGALREGVLRKHVIMADGYCRDSVMFSITDDEWPAVKAGLEARLGYVP